MTFDVSQYELADTASLTVKNARGDDDLLGQDGNPVVIEIYSPGSPPGTKALHRSGRQAQLRTMRMLRGEVSEQDAQNAEREHAEKLAAFTAKVSENFPVPALQIFTNPRLVYIARQVEQFIDKYGNFSKGSSAS